MRRQSIWSDTDGSAALEFIVAGVILLVPIVYLIVALGQIQSHALGVETGARQLARVVATSSGWGDAEARAEQMADQIARQYGMDPADVVVKFTCKSTVPACPQAGETVRVVVTAQARLPLVPPLFGIDQLARVPVEGSSVQKVSRAWRD